MIIIYIALAVVVSAVTIYFVIKSREFRKFMSGAFFVNAGMQFYLYLAHVSVPILGTNIVQTPEISGLRCIPNFIFFLLCFYFGFIRKPPDKRIKG